MASKNSKTTSKGNVYVPPTGPSSIGGPSGYTVSNPGGRGVLTSDRVSEILNQNYLANAPTSRPQDRASLDSGQFSDQMVAAVENYAAGAEDPAAAAAGGGGGGGGGYGAWQSQLDAQLQQALANIDALYNEQMGQATKGKDASNAQLASILTQHKADLANVVNDYNAQKAQIQASLAKTYSDVNAKVTASQQQAAQVLSQMGVDANRLMPGFQQNNSYLAQQGANQSAYDQRIGQLGSANLASRQANAENINAAGKTQVESNFSALQNKLNLWKLQQQQAANSQYQSGLAQIARASASGGGGSGGDGEGLSASEARLLNYQMDVAKFDFEQQKYAASQADPFDLSGITDTLALQAASKGSLKNATDWLDSIDAAPEAKASAFNSLIQNRTSSKTATVSNRDRIRAALSKSYSTTRR